MDFDTTIVDLYLGYEQWIFNCMVGNKLIDFKSGHPWLHTRKDLLKEEQDFPYSAGTQQLGKDSKPPVMESVRLGHIPTHPP